MVISLSSNSSHYTTHSIQESHILQSLSQSVSGNRMLEIAKIIAAVAIIALSFVAVAGGIYWLFFRKHAQPVDSNTTVRQKQSPQLEIQNEHEAERKSAGRIGIMLSLKHMIGVMIKQLNPLWETCVRLAITTSGKQTEEL